MPGDNTKKKWKVDKTGACNVAIVTDDKAETFVVWGCGCCDSPDLSPEDAEHIVKLHNESLEKADA